MGAQSPALMNESMCDYMELSVGRSQYSTVFFFTLSIWRFEFNFFLDESRAILASQCFATRQQQPVHRCK